jgi:hypothetical protein
LLLPRTVLICHTHDKSARGDQLLCVFWGAESRSAIAWRQASGIGPTVRPINWYGPIGEPFDRLFVERRKTA